MIPLKQAAILCCTTERNILNWAKSRKITYSRIGGTVMIDEAELHRVIEHNAKIGFYNEYLDDLVKIKQEEMSNVILQIDDLMYLFKSVEKISPLLRLWIAESSLLISDEKKRAVYNDMLSTKKISEVAKKHGLTHDRACYYYEAALKMVSSKLGFITQYRNTLARNQLKIRKLEIENTNLQDKLDYLSSLCRVDTETQFIREVADKAVLVIPDEYVQILSKKVTDLGLDVRTINAFKAMDIMTVEDFLRYLKGREFKRFKLKHFGKRSLERLRLTLIEFEIMNEQEYSYLYEYL